MRIFDYEDVMLLPNKCVVSSRTECETSVKLGKFKFKMPVVLANMKTVINEELAIELAKKNYFYIMHRFNFDSFTFVKKMQELNLVSSISIGVKKADFAVVDQFQEAGIRPDFITIDIAHGHADSVRLMIRYIKRRLGRKVFVIAGNVATPEAVRDLENWGADATKVGVGPGKVCITKLKTGFGSGDFMKAVEQDADWTLKFPDVDALNAEDKKFYDTEWQKIGDVREWEALGKPVKKYLTLKAKTLWDLINFCATYSAEPGVLFMDTANSMSNAKAYGQKVVCTNPCGEQPLAPYSVFNLVIHTLPGPTPTLVASAPQFSKSRTASGVATLPAITKTLRPSLLFIYLIIKRTLSACPWAISIVIKSGLIPASWNWSTTAKSAFLTPIEIEETKFSSCIFLTKVKLSKLKRCII